MTRASLHPEHRDLLHVAHHLLDHQLLDTHGERCGNVDDVVLRERNGVVELEAVVSGAGALYARYGGRLMRWLIGLGGRAEAVVPATAIGVIDGQVRLTEPAPALGLAEGEERAGALLARILGPDAHAVVLGRRKSEVDPNPAHELVDVMRLSELLGRELFDDAGRSVGTVHDLRFARHGRLLNEAAGNAWVLTHLLVGRRGMLERFGIRVGDMGAVPVTRIGRVDGSIVVTRPSA